MRDRLIELLEDTLHEWECDASIETLTEIADHLLANGVIVPVRCKECVYFEIKNSLGTQGICKCGEIETNYGGEFYPLANDYCSYGKLKDGEKR